MKALLSKKEPELEDLGNSQPIHIGENLKKKVCSEENAEEVDGKSLDKEIVDVNHGFNRPSPYLGTERELYQQRRPFWTREQSRTREMLSSFRKREERPQR